MKVTLLLEKWHLLKKSVALRRRLLPRMQQIKLLRCDSLYHDYSPAAVSWSITSLYDNSNNQRRKRYSPGEIRTGNCSEGLRISTKKLWTAWTAGFNAHHYYKSFASGRRPAKSLHVPPVRSYLGVNVRSYSWLFKQAGSRKTLHKVSACSYSPLTPFTCLYQLRFTASKRHSWWWTKESETCRASNGK